MYGYVKKPLCKWHSRSLKIRTPKINQLTMSMDQRTSNIKFYEMEIIASRHFSRPKRLAGKLSEWKLGEIKPFFVSFEYGRGKDRKKGRSELFNLFLFEEDISSELAPIVATLPL